MPRVLRNFWVACVVDGRKSRISGGPRARDGGVSLTIYQRQNGHVAVALTIEGSAYANGTLRLRVEPSLPCTVNCRDKTLTIETIR